MHQNAFHAGPSPGAITRRLRVLQRLAWFCAALVLAIIILSAYIRLSQTALGLDTARMAHRIIASGTLMWVLIILALSWRPMRPTLRPKALGLVGLVVFLAILGRLAGGSQLPAVILGNLLGGFLLFTLSVKLALACTTPSKRYPNGLKPWAWLAMLLVLIQVAVGGLVSAGHAGLSCPAFSMCDLTAGSWQPFMPWIEPSADLLPTHPGGAWIHMTHRVIGLGLMALLLTLSWRSWRLGRHRWACGLAALTVMQVTLGLVLIWLSLPLVGVLAHNMLAAILLAILANE